jgi:hypothetical protein
MKSLAQATLRKPPVFDAEGYQTNLGTINGTPLPKLDRIRVTPLRHGGARPGAGRKPSGRKPVLLRLAPGTVRSLRAAARREGKTLSDIAEERLAVG